MKKIFITLDDWVLSLFVGTLSLKFEGRSLKVILCDPMNGSPINFFENQTSRLTRAVRLFARTLLVSLILAQSERWRHG